MLKEEQVVELLRRYKGVLHNHLKIIKGNLRRTENRAAQVWELIVLDAAARIGQVKYESHPGSSPDIMLNLADGRSIWIEVAYIYPRFWQVERKINSTMYWIFDEAKKQGIPPYKIRPSLDPREKTNAGPILNLPGLHERKVFFEDREIKLFFKQIISNPNNKQKISLTRYSIILEYLPLSRGPYCGWCDVFLETPQTVDEHAVYRVLKKKAEQHDIEEPRIVCIGSDVNQVLSNVPALRGAIQAAFKEHPSLSATIIVKISTVPGRIIGCETIPQPKLFFNPYARNPISPKERTPLLKIRFDHWKYTWPLPKKETSDNHIIHKMSGRLLQRGRDSRYVQIIEIPANIVIDALAGKTTLDKEYELNEKDDPLRILHEGWEVKSCSFKDADLEAGEASKIVFELIPPSSLFHTPKPFIKKKNR